MEYLEKGTITKAEHCVEKMHVHVEVAHHEKDGAQCLENFFGTFNRLQVTEQLHHVRDHRRDTVHRELIPE